MIWRICQRFQESHELYFKPDLLYFIVDVIFCFEFKEKLPFRLWVYIYGSNQCPAINRAWLAICDYFATHIEGNLIKKKPMKIVLLVQLSWKLKLDFSDRLSSVCL